MNTGFYDLKPLDADKLKEFFLEAHSMSFSSWVDKLEGSWAREEDTEETILDMINACSTNYLNVAINRSIQYPIDRYAEIGYSTLLGKSKFLFIRVSLDNFDKLIEKYKLQPRD